MTTAAPALKVAILRPGLAMLPSRATDGAAAVDLHAALEMPVTLRPGDRAAIPTGVAIALPPGHEGQVRPRSGLAAQHGVTVLNAPGTIDEDYRGEVVVFLVNLGATAYTVEPGDRIAQLVVAPVTRVRVVEVESAGALGTTSRGAAGFGSTGR
jgi:dUTP pyrophosphatase